ncbi:MAG TPA: DUF2252 domain-containing protein [Pirellulales bacterium]|jgi:uncharacterized protein (DUF2252 family)|nr:DUF2252 domain-containing protein [Pirellulales bacterium]
MHQHHSTEIAYSLVERLAQGKALRQRVPRTSHAQWSKSPDRPDPIEMLEQTSVGRLPELVPIRYGRMVRSPFTFLRGSAAAMAYDLAATPTTGIRVQLGGDCHLNNFGAFGTPERNLIFDVMDFDETLPGPWEWDLKRLAASFVVAGRSIGVAKRDCEDAAVAVARTYRERMRGYAEMRAIEVWYAHIDATVVMDLARVSDNRRARQPTLAKARSQVASHIFPRMTEVVDGHRRIVDRHPLVFHPKHDGRFEEEMHTFFKRYRESLSGDRRFLLSRYRIVDVAMKVVGVGSVGTRCAVILLLADDDDPIFLQYKEAGESVLAPYAGKSQYANQGQRVVAGQRMMQSSSDILLGWSAEEGRDFYFRQLRDMKAVINIDGLSASALIDYGEMCGWALARAHAKSGDAGLISGYLGKSDVFDRAIATFARDYADVTEQDHAAMLAAVKSGRIKAESEDAA